jgi:hypothetical protein
MSNPIENPSIYNYFLLGGVRSPGLATIESGGDRAMKWENQQSPLTAGAITIFKGEEISKVSYTLTLWTPEHFTAWDAFASMLRAGSKKRPPQVWDLVDPALLHAEIKSVALATLSPAPKKVAPSKWTVSVEFTEYRKPKPSGGPVKPAQNEQEKANEALNNDNKALEQQLAAAKAAYAADHPS